MISLKLNRLLHFPIMIAAFLLTVSTAIAGPGGGTFYANSPSGGASGTSLRKFVDSLPGIGAANANNLGQYIPLATADTTTYPGSDYYEIGLRDYAEKMHSDLPKKTKLRGYYQVNGGGGADHTNHYLGPLILARQDRPVRVKFFNNLSTAGKGDLFIPVDTTVMGAGMGPYTASGATCDPTAPGATCAKYTQNRATLHLHGGNSPWISDGTTHQWITPAGENSVPAQMLKGVSVRDVPDMPATTQGQQTFYWTNQQSNRLMFYHDHSSGITRLNVYAGEAAGYLVADQYEDDLIDGTNVTGINPSNAKVLPNLGGVYRYGIPLVIQDKTFVPQNIAVQDAKWNNPKWGTYGDLWFPHVYETNQDPNSPTGANPFGRWDYGPWFWPPVIITDPAKQSLPDPSTVPESFMDTPIINGTAYPYVTVQPKPYRFRILNACNDRAMNLQLYYADPNDPLGTEVKMVPAAPNPAWPPTWPTDGRQGGVPDPTLAGPDFIQIGTESGFLPAPAVIPAQPVNYVYNRRDVVVLNVSDKSLYLQPAERADVIVDFSKVAPGSTLILYNDAPTPMPGFDPRYDYYTGNPDFTSTGGAPSTVRGYGPNIRTIMQIRVAGTPGTAFDLPALQTALPLAFKASQPPLLVPEPTYPAASGANAPTEIYAKIQDYSLNFTPLNDVPSTQPVLLAGVPTTIPFHPKAIQELWDPYGRMNATLGIELPFTSNLNQTTIPMGYAEPTTETIVDGQPQIWKITHNGVDTHPVHFHMLSVQIINRVGWDGAIRPPDANELGWKETVRMNPLEDIIVALLPKSQTLPFALPSSTRPLDPSMPPAAPIAVTDIGNLGLGGTPVNGIATTISNTPVGNPAGYDYANEFVWHCHILGHEENDFMRPLVFRASITLPPAPTSLNVYTQGQTVPGLTNYVASYINQYQNQIVLQWVDGSSDITAPSSFLIQRSINGGAFTTIATIAYLPGFPPIFTDKSVAPATSYRYRVIARNAIGDSAPLTSATVTSAAGPWAATGVTLTPNRPSPHVIGSNVLFTAVGSGAPANLAYYYQFQLSSDGGATWTTVQDYSSSASWALSDTTPIANYIVKVNVRTSSAVPFDASAQVAYNVVAAPLPPATVASPVPGIYWQNPTVPIVPPVTWPPAPATIPVTLTATNSSAVPAGTTAPTIYYTTDGSIPTTATLTKFAPASAAVADTISGTINLTATTTINYLAVDVNGNAEAMHSDVWFVHSPDMVTSVKFNGGATVTNNRNVMLNLTASDPAGVATMQFSNADNSGVCSTNPADWSAEFPYQASQSWDLNTRFTNDGTKTVCIKFRDKSLPYPPGLQYPAVTASIVLDTVAPTTAASPVAGTYAGGPISVTLTCTDNVGGVGCDKIYYTTDGTAPTYPPTGTTTVYTQPIPVTNIAGQSTSIRYLSVDLAGNAEPATSGTWTMSGNSFKTTIKINNGAANTNTRSVLLDLSADSGIANVGIASMAFSTDGNAWSGDIPIGSVSPTLVTYPTASSVAINNYPFTLPIGSDGLRAVYVRFTNLALPTGGVSDPASAIILLDTAPPVTTATPVAGTYASGPLPVTLTCSDGSGSGCDKIYYTLDGSIPSVPPAAPSASTLVYTGPISVADMDAITYRAVDLAGNAEAARSGVWQIHVKDLIGSVAINAGATVTNSTNAKLKLMATDGAGIVSFQLSNDNVNYTAEYQINSLATIDPNAVINTTATTATIDNFSWNLLPGDGQKTVYVRFRDGSSGGGILYDPVMANISLDTTPAITTAAPIPGVYSSAPVVVTLMTNKQATIYYTVDGSAPTTSSSVYVGSIPISNTTTIKYFSIDTAGNVEPVGTGTWTIHSSDMVSSIAINNGASVTKDSTVLLSLSAFDPVGIAKMTFSNDGVVYSPEEDYAPSKLWALAPGDGVKVVYVRFRDKSLPTGNLYEPIAATILLDTVSPVTSVSPVPGTYVNFPLTITLTPSENATIYYTTDGSNPNTSSAKYTGPFTLNNTATIKLFAVDTAGNAEPIKSGTWVKHTTDLVSNIVVNSGANWTNNTTVTLTISATDPSGVATMQFSNDGVAYSNEEAYATSKQWTLSPGEGQKTVYVRFRDGALGGGNQYAPTTATILFGNKDGMLPGTTTYLTSALKALQIAVGLVVPTSVDLVHGDVAPYRSGNAKPDGKIDILDAYAILLRQLGLIAAF